jgi:hypothetical protein
MIFWRKTKVEDPNADVGESLPTDEAALAWRAKLSRVFDPVWKECLERIACAVRNYDPAYFVTTFNHMLCLGRKANTASNTKSLFVEGCVRAMSFAFGVT